MHKMMVFMSRRMIACDEATYKVSRRQEEGLGFRQRMALGMHLLTCHLCRRYARQMEQLSRLMQSYRSNPGQESVRHQLDPASRQEMTDTLGKALNAE